MGRNLENQAIAMWTTITGDPAVRMDDYAKVDALFLPHLNADVDPIPRPPYFLEVHGRRTPLINSPNQRLGMKVRVYDAVLNLSKIAKMQVIWLVVGPDVILNLSLPAVVDGVQDGRVYFNAAIFSKLESASNRAFFEGSF